MAYHSRSLTAALGVALLALQISPASAQETREALIVAEQEKKAAELKPYEPGAAERWAVALRREFIGDPNGFYPLFASVYSGGGLTLGAGYRRFYGDRTHWDVQGLYSIKGYKLIELSTTSWGHARGRVDLRARAGWRDATQVAFYGLGIDSSDLRTDFRMKQAYVGGELKARPGAFTVFGAGVMYEDYTLEEPTGPNPWVEDVFSSDTAPGIGVSPAYVHTMVSGGIDWRPSPGYARRGGLYEIRYHNYADRDGVFSFDRVDAEIVQHVPILRENWVISLRGLVQTTLDDDDQVPYFLLPALGSGSTLRAYSSWRYRDRHSLLLNGELRWIPNRLGLDMAVFYDMGKVTPRWDDLSLDGLKSDVGIGVRFHGPYATPLRVEVAYGREGPHLVFAGSAAF
ncbi:MAG TPA: hypothetical protein VF159_04060 [Gemmatimonadaceae bacterium]